MSLLHLLHPLLPHLPVVLRRGEIHLHLRPDQLLATVRLLEGCSLLRFTRLQDLFGIDRPAGLEVVYRLQSLLHNRTVVLRVLLEEQETPLIPTLSSLYPAANWLEREVWDLFGIQFSGHPDLRRILTDYGFVGFPLRKGYPLVGFEELRYDSSVKRVVSEPVRLTQEYRYFDFLSPW
jgi:NADH-quinone oxidoreductase subunit C